MLLAVRHRPHAAGRERIRSNTGSLVVRGRGYGISARTLAVDLATARFAASPSAAAREDAD